MGGRTGQSQTSSQTTILPEEQQTNVDMLLRGARDFYRTGGPKYFEGNTVAGPTDTTLAGRQGQLGYASGIGQNFVNQAVQGDQFFLNPNNIFDPTRIPGYAAAREGTITDATNALQRNLLPSIRQGAVSSGAYGSSRQGIAEGLATGEAARGLGDTLARMDMDAYNQGLNMYNAAQNRAGQTYALGQQPYLTQQAIGNEYQQDQQRQIDADVQRWNFQQLAPLLNLQNLQGLTGTAGQYGGTVNETQKQKETGGGGWQQYAGAALSLLALL